MLMSVLGAVLAGAAASFVLPFLPFAAALTLASMIGGGWAIVQGHAIVSSGLGAFALLVATQVGYGLGLLLAAAWSFRKVQATPFLDSGKSRHKVRDFRFGKES